MEFIFIISEFWKGPHSHPNANDWQLAASVFGSAYSVSATVHLILPGCPVLPWTSGCGNEKNGSEGPIPRWANHCLWQLWSTLPFSVLILGRRI